MEFEETAGPEKVAGDCEMHHTSNNKLFGSFTSCTSWCFTCTRSCFCCFLSPGLIFQQGILCNPATPCAYSGLVNPHFRKSYLTTASTAFWFP